MFLDIGTNVKELNSPSSLESTVSPCETDALR